MKYKYFLFTSLLCCASLAAEAQTYPYQNADLSFHERAKNLVSLLTLDEKINQVGHQTLAISRDGISVPGYNYWNEALHGVARSGLATSFPESKGMSATWDRQLIYDCAWATSDEARVYNNTKSKGLIYWCPTINMSRDPRWGRDEENYGEDPYLTGQLAIQYIKGMQGDDGKEHKYYKTVATAKHFAANNYEKGRHSTSSTVNDFNLREYYLPAFEDAVKQANVRSVMSAYNELNGTPCCASPVLLTNILRQEWGFNGFVTSDCGAIDDIYQSNRHHWVETAAEASGKAIVAGEDLNCGSTFQDACKEAIEKGYMTEADLDSALVRVFEARFSVGEFDAKSDVEWTSVDASKLDCMEHRDLAYKAAQEAIVLLKNEGNFLPLSKEKSVAVIGPFGNTTVLGGYSGSPVDLTTPFEGIAAKVGYVINDGTIQFEDNDGQNTPSGSKRLTHEANGSAGNVGYIFSGDWLSYNNINFGEGCSKLDVYHGAKNSNPTTMEIYLDEIDSTPEATVELPSTGNWSKYITSTFDVDASVFKGTHTVYAKFVHKNKYGNNMDWMRFYDPNADNPLETQGPAYYYQGCDATSTTSTNLTRAAEIAKKADVVVVALGTNLDVSDESNDRKNISLPGDQQKLLEAIYEANNNVVLLLESCSSLDISWAQKHVPAIVEAWYDGQAQGKAIADVLYGDYNPSGKITSTWYASQSDLPSGMLDYNIEESKYTYMFYDKTPLYPFGFGLSYTTFEYSNLQLSKKTLRPGQNVTLTFDIKNTGSRDGVEIPQMYIHTNGTLGGQKLQLKGFDRIEVPAGATRTVKMLLDYDALSHFNGADNVKAYEVERGVVDIKIGASSSDIRLSEQINVDKGAYTKATYETPSGLVTAINAPNAGGGKTSATVFNINGIPVGTSENINSLPKGLYIVSGEKYIKKLR